MVTVIDSVLDQLFESIGKFEPERGGALLGPPGLDVVSDFIADPHAQTTGSTYRSSAQLNAQVQAAEVNRNLEFKGIVHSHPSRYDRPSAQDESEFAESLRINHHLGRLTAFIVTSNHAPTGSHQVAYSSMVVSAFAVFRGSVATSAQIVQDELRVLTVASDLQEAVNELGLTAPVSPTVATDVGGVPVFSSTLLGDMEVTVMAGLGYPLMPPVLLMSRGAESATQLCPDWHLDRTPTDRLKRALSDAMRADNASNGRVGMESGQGAPASRHLFARSSGLLSERLAESSALIVGCGSVGSYFAELLTRSGVGRLVLLDPDEVEPANLSRTVYVTSDLGQPKTEALARRVREINANVRVEQWPLELQEIGAQELDSLVRSVDLVAGLTDDLAAQALLNRLSYSIGRPAVFVGMYAAASGGEVIISEPPYTCYLCATAGRQQYPSLDSTLEIDYTTGRLSGEVGLAADIHHVTSAAAKLALARLSRAHPDAGVGEFAADMLEMGSTCLTLSMEPNYWFYPVVFEGTRGQYAYQSVWLQSERNDDCAVCGPEKLRVHHLDVPVKPPDPATLAAAARRAEMPEKKRRSPLGRRRKKT